jgi:hypothetical protein
LFLNSKGYGYHGEPWRMSFTAYESGGQEFESLRARQQIKSIT